MRRHMKAEMQEMEEKLRTAAKIMVLKERESWRSERGQLLDERRTIQRQLSVTEEQKWKKLHEVLEKAAGVIKKRDERHHNTQREETERKRASVEEEFSRLKSVKELAKKKVSQLEDLLRVKDEEISRANEKRRAHTIAHIDTLALLNETESAIKQSQLTCETPEEKLRKQLADRQAEKRASRRSSLT
eukprot:superscaffoldBa00000611_g6049